MIPAADILAWRAAGHPWLTDAQVEQDLIICRALVDFFNQPLLREQLAFRGGTALHKLHLKPARRYSEDIDLVQMTAGPIGAALDAIHAVLDPWLGEPRRTQKEGSVALAYRVSSEIAPVVTLRLKIEINTREHFAVRGLVASEFAVQSRWFAGKTDVPTFSLEELLGTKLRALYQRRKGRDLFDLWLGCTAGHADVAGIVDVFRRYLAHEGNAISQAEFHQNLALKMNHQAFKSDLPPLLRPGIEYDPVAAHRFVTDNILSLL